MSDESELLKEVSLEDLPVHILENILEFLPEWDLAKISSVSKWVNRLANKVMRKKFFRLADLVDVQLEEVRREINACSLSYEGVFSRVILYRSYSAFEFLRSEMNSSKALGRTLLYSENRAFNFGRLLQEYTLLFSKAKEKLLPPWQVNDWLTLNIWKLSRIFLTEKNLFSTGSTALSGTRIIDLIDTMIIKEFKISLRFYVFKEFDIVSVDAIYYLHPQYLARPPSFEEDDTRSIELTKPDDNKIKLLMEYLFNIVKVNNRIVLREEQYNRELELNSRRGEPVELQHGPGVPLPPGLRWVNQEPRGYPRASPASRLVEPKEDHFLVTESLLSPGFVEPSHRHNKV